MSKKSRPATQLQTPSNTMRAAEACVAHWSNLNQELGQPLRLSGGYGVVEMAQDLKTLAAKVVAIEASQRVVKHIAETLERMRDPILERVFEFHRLIELTLSDPVIEIALPPRPNAQTPVFVLMGYIDAVGGLWTRLNAAPDAKNAYQVPVFLEDDFGLISFAREVARFRATLRSYEASLETQERSEFVCAELAAQVAHRIDQYSNSLVERFGVKSRQATSLLEVLKTPPTTLFLRSQAIANRKISAS